MSLAQELRGVRSKCLYTSNINRALRNHDVEEIARFIRSSEDFDEFRFYDAPDNEELGRHVSDAIVQNSHIKTLHFWDTCAIRASVAWIRSRHTLVNTTSLETVVVVADHDMSVLDCTALFPLLLMSTSLSKFDIKFYQNIRCTDDVMTALSSYLSAASLREFRFDTRRLSEADFTALCNGVASSTVRQFTLDKSTLENVDLETAAEALAQMIAESLLEEVVIAGRVSTWNESLISALKLTAPVRNMDFAFTHIGDNTTRLRIIINRKWKPLVLSANTLLALWPRILEKSHVFPETSHGSADIVFYVSTQKPDLVPAP